MPFASFKNIQKRYARTHKERSQPEHRRHLGFLPKKKDFILKARDKEKKQQKVKEYRRQALTKNEDEFYFNMCNSTLDPERGHIPLNANVEYSNSTLKTLHALSVIQLRGELQKELAKIRRLEASANLLQGDPNLRSKGAPARHVFFAEDGEEAASLREAIRSGTVGPPCGSKASVVADRAAVYDELHQRLERAEQLKLLLAKREAKQNLLSNKDRKCKKVAKETKHCPPIYQFEPVRSR